MKYTEYDLKLIDLIKSGCNSFGSLCCRMADENEKIQPGHDRFRVTDRRLQALRRQSRIAYLRSRQIWIIQDASNKNEH